MARVRMVTRTINVTVAKAMCLNVVTAEVSINSFELTGASFDNDTALKMCKKMYETEELKVVAIQELTEREEIYGMLETEFLKVAKKLDSDRHFVEDEEVEE